MKVFEIKNIVRKDVPIYYRRIYTGVVVLELINKPVEIPLEFLIEHKPTGQMEINVTLLEKVDYPLIPLQTALKKFISELDSTGNLPAT